MVKDHELVGNIFHSSVMEAFSLYKLPQRKKKNKETFIKKTCSALNFFWDTRYNMT